jgi:hypothetical protein
MAPVAVQSISSSLPLKTENCSRSDCFKSQGGSDRKPDNYQKMGDSAMAQQNRRVRQEKKNVTSSEREIEVDRQERRRKLEEEIM